MDASEAHLNEYQGNEFQQSVSVLAVTNQDCYEREGACHSEYSVEVSRFCFSVLKGLFVDESVGAV